MSVAFFRNITDLWKQITNDVARFNDDYENANFFLEKLKKRIDTSLGKNNKNYFQVCLLLFSQ